MNRSLILILSLICCSCIQLGGSPTEHDYYRLDSLVESVDEKTTASLNINLELIDFPDFLKKSKIITRGQDFRIIPSSNAHWSEPLDDNLMRTLRVNIKRQHPKSQIALLPWEMGTNAKNKHRIEIIVNDFSGVLGDRLTVDIDWFISNNDGVIQGHFIDNRSIGSSYPDMVEALSQAASDFSKELIGKLSQK